MTDTSKDGGPAFPQTTTESYGGELAVDVSGGMSLRDWFAGQALIGMGTWSPVGSPMEPTARAEWAYQQADAILAERERR